jgi:hypothetical protein
MHHGGHDQISGLDYVGWPAVRGFGRRAERLWFVRIERRAVMIGFVRKLWRRHKVKAADRRMFLDQGHSSPRHSTGDSEHMIQASWDVNRHQ